MAEYIDREQLKLALLEDLHNLQSVDEHTVNIMLMDVDEAPVADVAPVVRGKWIDYSEPDEDGNRQCYCSHCYAGDVQRVGEKVSYCWKCGAKMDGE